MKWLCPRCKTRFSELVERCPYDGKRPIDDLSGLTIADRYTVRELIGIGGMGSSVWQAWQKSTERSVAIKVLPPANEAAAGRFARGGRIASNLNHPHITVVHDYGQTPEGQLFLVMELLEGHTLHRILKDTGGLPAERALYMTDQVLRALEHAHRQRVVHRDLKPGNLFLVTKNEDDDYVKVLDFGIAKYIAEDPEDGQDRGSGPLEVTQEQQVCGTPHYMAPEQVAMGRVDARTDLYSLGIVLYRMLTGRLPFEGRSHHELFRQHLTEPPPPFVDVRPDLNLPEELETLVFRALAKSPDERFNTAGEMRAALRVVRRSMGAISGDPDESMSSLSLSLSMQSTGPGLPTPTPTPAPNLAALTHVPKESAPPRRRTTLVLLVALLMMGGAAVAWYWLRGDRSRTMVADRTGPAPGTPSVKAGPPDVRPPAPVEPQPAAPPKEQYSSVFLETTPPNAVVRWKGSLLGRTPVKFRLPTGLQNVELSLDGYRSEKVLLDLTAGGSDEQVARKFQLEALPKPEPVAAVEPAAPDPPPAQPIRRARPSSRARAQPRPAVAAAAPTAAPQDPTPSTPAAQQPEAKPKPSVRVQLLDEGESRSFGVGNSGGTKRPGAPSRPPTGANITLLDEDDTARPSNPSATKKTPPNKPKVNVDLLEE